MKGKMMLYFFCLCLIGCTNNTVYTQSPKGYDLNAPQVYNLHDGLEEISGIAFDPNDPQSIYAQEDETGTLYQLGLDGSEKQAYRFGADGDYEDIAIVDTLVYLLKSNGDIFSFSLEKWKLKDPVTSMIYEDLVPKGEYEGLAYSPEDGHLYLLCKECPTDKKKDAVTVYQLKLDNGILSRNNKFSVPDSLVVATQGSGKAFKPSALSQHPVSKQWYLLSSVNRMLVIADENWNPKEAYLLDRKMFPQPEGMAFDRENNLWISNEAGDADNATLLTFTFKTD